MLSDSLEYKSRLSDHYTPPWHVSLTSKLVTHHLSVYYVAVRTIVLSRHGSYSARPVIIHDIIHGLIYGPSTPCCGFFGVSPDGNCAYVHWGSFTSTSKSVRRAIWFTWFSEPHECIQHLAVPGGHPSNYERGATLLNFASTNRWASAVFRIMDPCRTYQSAIFALWHPLG